MKNKKEKIIIIIALVVALVSLSVGFAAFSSTINISSSASVTPNENDYKVVVYGFKSKDAFEHYETSWSLKDEDLSISYAAPTAHSEGITTANISISSISNSWQASSISAYLKKPGDYVEYDLVVKNEGQYDAYISSDDATKYIGIKPFACSADDASAYGQICNSMKLSIKYLNRYFEMPSDLINMENSSLLPKNSYAIIRIRIEYDINGAMADEEYEFHWSDISINFKTNIENQEKQLIEFYVDGSKLYAEPNMLWIEFVNSQYAPQGTYFINDNKVCLGMIGSIAIDGGTMPIEPNYNYQLLSPEC